MFRYLYHFRGYRANHGPSPDGLHLIIERPAVLPNTIYIFECLLQREIIDYQVMKRWNTKHTKCLIQVWSTLTHRRRINTDHVPMSRGTHRARCWVSLVSIRDYLKLAQLTMLLLPNNFRWTLCYWQHISWPLFYWSEFAQRKKN